jgi:hypothetical protein
MTTNKASYPLFRSAPCRTLAKQMEPLRGTKRGQWWPSQYVGGCTEEFVDSRAAAEPDGPLAELL